MNRLKLRESILDSINHKLKNVNINDCTKALLGIVKDRQDGTIFYDYEPRETIGLYIYAELLDKYDEKIGFILSDDVKESGMLTQAQGACNLDVLISDYKILSVLDGNDAERLREIYEKTINSILDMVIADDGSIVIDATPYNIDVFDSEYAYVDAITWVVSALLGALNFCEANNKYFEAENSGISFSNEVQQRILNVISFCVRYLVECFIDITDKNEKKLSQGWNFTKKCSEPSLYFTYAVSECQLDIYDFFKQVIDKHDIELKIERIKKQYSLEKDDDFYLYLSAEDKMSYESINENSEEFKLKKKLFDVINGHENFYYEFSNQVKLAARNAWSLTKDGIDSKFYNGNLSGIVDVSTIESSSSSDALFNNIFVINNVISGAIDEEISDRLAMAVDDDEMNKIQSEYDALLETLQAAVQRIIRYNKTLQSRQKDYIINDFIISCNELFEGDVVKKSQELRKKKIKAFTLSPLLVKTNNLISEFLTKYPQYDMIKYLDELLMKKRSMDDDGNYIWLWEGGEYHITSNYYYLTSLAGFYKYLDAYESRFSAIDHSNESYKTSLLDAQLRELRKSGEIFKLTDQTKKLQEANEKLQDQVTELKSQESEVERVIRDLLHREIKENLIVWITEGVTEMKEDVYAHLFDDDFDATHTKEFAFFDSFKKMIVMSFLKTFQERLTYFDLENNRAGDVADLLKRDMEEKYKRLITGIIESPEFNK
ncbi:MAG TPA: hypothetical protein DCS04_05455 [Ruminococcaceae bacterium]|nr:hypothetical protein [Oscillospiraceae bacterium]